MIPETERMRLPAPPPPARRAGIPVIAILAPVVMAGALWVMTSSPHVLLFAFLGPVVAMAGWLDGRRTARRDRRAGVAVGLRRLDELASRVEERAEELRRSLERAASVRAPIADEGGSAPFVVRLGTGDLPSGVAFESDGGEEVPELAAAIDTLRDRAALIRDAPVLIDEPLCDVVATGPTVLVRAFARALTIQAVESCPVPDGQVLAPAGETWTRRLPHNVADADHWEVRTGDRRLLRVRHGASSTPAGAVLVRLGDEAGAAPRVESPHVIDSFAPVLVCTAEAGARAQEIAGRARLDGWRAESEIPATVALSALSDVPDDPEAVLSAVVGRDAEGQVHLDLDRDGPHALVAGTTGSGKSELLVTWVLALARDRAPHELGFLLIDFKGGAAFAPLRDLPHVVGMVSDLDPATAARAVQSLRAELRRREEALALHGARSIAEMPPGALSRLVIVVDEFAALVALDAELHAVFADLAARGRSLGLHLIVCTQRPAGIVRESVLANITLRICLRVLAAADSVAVVGHAGAAALPPEARGRGVLSDGGRERMVQFALSDPADASSIATRWAGHPRSPGRPWLDPLPASLPAGELAAFVQTMPEAGGVLIGAIDLPERQRRDPFVVDPWEGGAVLVLGATGSGRSTTLDMIASAVDAELRRVPDDPAELWQALATPVGNRRVLVILDDLDRTLAWVDQEQRADLTELLARAARDARRSGLAIAASARSGGGALHALQTVFEQRIILRLASREEHLLAGGRLGGYRADRLPGSCTWRDAEAQVALPPPIAREAWRATLEEVVLTEGLWSIVTPRPSGLVDRLAGAGVAATSPGSGIVTEQTTVGDADGWLVEHAASATARRSGRLLLIGCNAADHRAITRARAALPPLSGDDEAWLFDGVTTRRVRFRVA